MPQKITPNLWCDHNAIELVDFYTSIFPAGKVNGMTHYPNSPEEGLADFQLDLAGEVLTIDFSLAGHDFTAINAGPEFQPTHAVSFTVHFDTSRDTDAKAHLDEVWQQLIDDGEALIELGEHPFSPYYGWVKDKFGYSWQLNLITPQGGETRPCIMPSLLFAGRVQNQAKEAIDYYLSVFSESTLGNTFTYGQSTGPAQADSLAYADFRLEDEWFIAMDSGVEQDTNFNETVSFAVVCEGQAEIDTLWKKLSAVPEAEQCGWCKDKFGVSWQIVPANMAELMQRPDAFTKMMQMHKLVIDEF